MQKLSAIAAVSLVFAASSAASAAIVYLDNDFSTDTVGSQPASMTVLGPGATNTGTGTSAGDVGVVVVASSAIGTGNAVRLYDRSTVNANSGVTAARDAFTSTASSGIVRVNFTAGPNLGPVGDGNTFIRLGLGSASVNVGSSSDGNNHQRVVLDRGGSGGNPGRIAASSNTSGSLSDSAPLATFNPSNSHLLEIYFNYTAAPINYGTGESVGTHKYDLWLNGTRIANEFNLRTGPSGAAGFGFASGGTQSGADWVFDNLRVTAIPEPATLGLLAGAGLLALRRRK